MGTLVYYNAALTLAVGAQHVVNDCTFDSVDGSVYRIKEVDLIWNAASDTGNTWYSLWLSVLKDGRASFNPFSEGFAADIIGNNVKVQAADPFGGKPFETPEDGYLADDPYFQNNVRFGISGNANVAGGDVTLALRMTAERVKRTSEISDLMYGRSYT